MSRAARRGGLRTIVLALLVAAVGAACAAATSTASSPFLDGFAPDSIAASINALPGGPRCPGDSEYSRGEAAGPGGSSSADAVLTTSCEDPGDGTKLAQSWGAGIDAELRRLGADLTMTGTGTTSTGASVIDAWEYASSGIRGRITLRVLAASQGGYTVTVRINEPPVGPLEGPSPIVSSVPAT